MVLKNDENLRSQRRNIAWSQKVKRDGYWVYKRGERKHLPVAFEDFYQRHKAEFRNVLDVGCGTGRFMIPMLQDGLDVTGVEPSDGMRMGAKTNLEAAKDTLKGKVVIVNAESKNLDFTDESFDFVFAKGSIHHNTWGDIQQSFREVARILKPGKFFIFQGRSTKDSDLLNAERISDVGVTAKDKQDWKKGVIQHYFTKEEIEQLAVENGFEIVVGPEEIIRGEIGKENARWWVVYKKLN